jgi:uncharacterized protein
MIVDLFIEQTRDFVKQTLKNAEGGHDWWHIYRVWNNAKRIAQTETADRLTVELAALLHDIADSKFHNGDEEIGPKTATNYLRSIGVDETVVQHVEQVIRHMFLRPGLMGPGFIP